MTYFIKFLWVAGFAALFWVIYQAAIRGYFDKASFSKDGTRYKFDKARWDTFFPVTVVVTLIVVALLAGCSSGTVAPTAVAVAPVNCQGTYVGSYGPPEHDERIRLRNLSLKDRGIAVTGNHDIDNANAGGGAPDGGIWMGGSYSFETDANCNVVKGQTMIFYAYEYDIGGTVQKDGTFNLTWSGQGSAGEMVGKIEADNNITGKFFHPAPDSYVYGVLSGTFTPAGK